MDAATFAQQIAQALLEKESAEENRSHSNPSLLSDRDRQQLIHDTYLKLCHDDPADFGLTSVGCTALAQALLDPRSPYALSNRLVNGITQCCQRFNNKNTKSSKTKHATNTRGDPTTDPVDRAETEEDNDKEAPDNVGSLFPLTTDAANNVDASSSLSAAYAQLAWTVHVAIPLECCRLTIDTMPVTVASYLGSFMPPAPPLSTSISRIAGASDNDEQGNDNEPVAPIHNEAVDAGENEALNGNHNGVAALGAGAEAAVVAALNGNDNHHADINGIDAARRENNDRNGNDDTDSLAEVFAAESDDSDYEFESDYHVQDNVEALTAWARTVQQSFDPLYLSQPRRDNCANNDNVALHSRTVQHLVQSLTHSHIAALPLAQYQQLRCANLYTQLTLALLVPSSSQHSPILTNSSIAVNEWQRLGTHVLHVFRDCTLQYHHQHDRHHAQQSEDTVWEDFLRLIRILLQVDANNHNGAAAATIVVSTQISTATWIGLHALSTLCLDVVQATNGFGNGKALHRNGMIHILQRFIVEAADDLADVLEKASRTCTSKNSNSTQNGSGGGSGAKDDTRALQWSCLSLFQILASTDGTLTQRQHTSGGIPNDQAQLLLNSGLFRQWLLLWSQMDSNDDDDDKDCRTMVQATILDVCLASPSLLGKYAWRFPGLAVAATHTLSAAHATTSSSSTPMGPNDSTDRDDSSQSVSLLYPLLWNLFGIHILKAESAGSSAPKVQWRPKAAGTATNKATPPVVTLESCQHSVRSMFDSMCTRTVRILTDWKLRRQHNVPNEEASSDDNSSNNRRKKLGEQLTVLHDWHRLARRLVWPPLVRTLLVECLTCRNNDLDDDDRQQLDPIQRQLQPIQHVLSHWPVVDLTLTRKPDIEDAIPKAADGNSNDNPNATASSLASTAAGTATSTPATSNSFVLEQEEAVRTVRKAIKTIVSILESVTMLDGSGGDGNNNQQQRVSSKAD